MLDRYEANYLLGKLKVSDIMTKSVWTVRESDSVETAAYLLYTHKVGALPVVDGTNHITGIISDTDIFKAFVDIMGYNQTSTKGCYRYERIKWVSLPNYPRSLRKGG